MDEGYFEHLERIRGESKKLKVREQAREAVMQGVAGEREVRMAAKGVEVDRWGNVIPSAGEDWMPQGKRYVNGETARKEDEDSRHRSDSHIRDRQDISLHNLNDHYGQM